MAKSLFYVSAALGGAYNGGSSATVKLTAADEFTVDGGSTTTITHNSGTPWTGCSVGDWLCFDEVEWRRITVIDGDDATVHAACTPANGVSCTVGGPLSTLDAMLDIANADGPTDFTDADGDAPQILCRDLGSEADLSLSTNFLASQPIEIVGCGSDWTPYSRWGTDRVVLTGSPTGNYVLYIDAAYVRVVGLDIEATGSSKRGLGASGNAHYLQVQGCRLAGTHSAFSPYSSLYLLFENNLVEDSPYGIYNFWAPYYAHVRNNVFRDMTTAVFHGSRAGNVIENNLIYDCTDVAVYATTLRFYFRHNTVADCTGDVFSLAGETELGATTIVNNIVENIGGGMVASTLASGNYYFGEWANNGINGVTDPDDKTYIHYDTSTDVAGEMFVETTPATRVTNGDYRIAAAARGAGFPAAMPDGGATVASTDLGAAQAVVVVPIVSHVLTDDADYGYYSELAGEATAGGSGGACVIGSSVIVPDQGGL